MSLQIHNVSSLVQPFISGCLDRFSKGKTIKILQHKRPVKVKEWWAETYNDILRLSKKDPEAEEIFKKFVMEAMGYLKKIV